MTVAYFDCFSGASGDMILGVLVDAGVSLDRLRERMAALPLDGYSLTSERVVKQGFVGTQVRVELDPSADSPHRHLGDVVSIIEGGGLPDAVARRAVAVFRRLAEAEAEAHGCSVEQVHFHEVGAVDAIVDVVGAMVGLDELGVTRVFCSPIPVGSGTVKCAHGVIPVPAPATVRLLQGVPLLASDEPGELTTPTGAAILSTLAESYGPLPGMTVRRCGYGAGNREGRNRPNLLRLFLGEAADEGGMDQVEVLECNLDDASSETVGFCMAKLLEAGALDVYAVPITMKKSRPGVVLTVLAEPRRVSEFAEIIFRETTTFGVRRHSARREKLDRRLETVDTDFGPIRVKVGTRGGVVYTAAPEYEDCRLAADTAGVALRVVMQEATQAWAVRNRP